MLRITPALLLSALAACAISDAKTVNDVNVDLASVTLGENCGAVAPQPPPPPPGKFAKPPPGEATRSERAPSGKEAPGSRVRGDCAGPNCGMGRRRCNQTSMQLTFTAQSGIRPTTIKIKRVELLDTNGKVLEVLSVGVASFWTQNAYYAWNQQVRASEVVRASYTLSSPDWNKLTGGRMKAHAHTFQLRVTVTVGNGQTTVEKQSITPARIEPMVVT